MVELEFFYDVWYFYNNNTLNIALKYKQIGGKNKVNLFCGSKPQSTNVIDLVVCHDD